ncbi:MAG TPA: exonuclease, partial [Sutterella sp.]|nr:exonuclease [Sutterella sp.]
SGLGFSAKLPEPDLSPFASYPLASVKAFSIDNLETTEIDDAFSVEDAGENYRIGIHIAAPALAIERDDAIDRVAQSRYSTVYAPGIKVTMLPESWANAFSLFENRDNVCLSLYAVIRKDDFEVITSETRLERVFVAANLRTEKIEASLSPEGLENDTLTIPFAHELSVLYRAAERLQKHREEVRGRPEIKNRTEYSIVLTGEGEDATVSLAERARGAPVDFIVSELMIFANATWGGWLEDTHRAGIYRTQSKGKVKMTSVAGPHDAIGVNSYAWCTSPVRRYVDLVNQRQLISSVENREAVYRASDADLFSIISNFTFTYAAYGDFQRQMERYWSLRYIEQEGFTTLRAVVIKEDLVQLEKMPFLQRIPGLPTLPRGQVIVLNVASIDYVSVVLDATLREVLSENVSDEIDTESIEEVTVEVESQPEAQSA